MTHLAVLTGLASEARLLRRAAARHGAGVTVAVGGAVPGRTRAAARDLAAARPRVLVSFGLAGGLDPDLSPGALVCPERIQVVAADGGTASVLQPDPTWRAWLVSALAEPVAGGTLVAARRAVTTPAEKAALARAGGSIVDMETAALAEAAAESGTPLLVLRALCDPAGRAVPPALLALLGADGGLRWRALPGALPGTLRALPTALALAGDSRRAHRRLSRAAEALCRAAVAQGQIGSGAQPDP